MRIFALSLIAYILFMPTAFACKCVQPNAENSKQAFERMDAIITGDVILTSEGWQGSGPLATLRVTKVTKGVIKINEIIVVQYNSSTAACGMGLREGETYQLGLYALKSLDKTKRRPIGDYRTAYSCDQWMVKYYLENTQTKED